MPVTTRFPKESVMRTRHARTGHPQRHTPAQPVRRSYAAGPHRTASCVCRTEPADHLRTCLLSHARTVAAA